MQNYVTGFEPYNKCLCKLRIKGKYNNIMLINAYAPTEDHTEETKQQFYDNLQYLLDKTPKSDIIIILGDVTAQLGKEKWLVNIPYMKKQIEIVNYYVSLHTQIAW